ncbi:MAG: hypothetical protein Q9225_002543 [Loekoesia sp. 1 TL-2023]
MADLSSLLNPAPSSDSGAQKVDATEGDVDHSGAKASDLPPVKVGPSNVQPSIKSPLDTLADAATSSAPLLSPTNPNGTSFMGLGAYGHAAVQQSSRPTSSHFSPPRAFDHSHAPGPTSPTFSPGLQQYHHPTSSEVRARRASETAETLIEPLPPLRRSLPDNELTNSDEPAHSFHQADTATSILPGIDAAAASVQDQPIGDYTENTHAPVTSQIRHPSSGPSVPAEQAYLSQTQSEQTEVKTEIADTTSDLTSTSLQPQTHKHEPLVKSNQAIENSTLTTDMKPNSSPVPADSSAENVLLKPQPAPSRKRPAPKKGTATTVKPASKKRKVEKANNSIENLSPLARSGTPTSSRASKTPAPKGRKQESATPQRSSSIANDDSDDDGGIFCICRGPDDHTWMIACDGPCEDWFHGRCINMTEKESQLIEKYYWRDPVEAHVPS